MKASSKTVTKRNAEKNEQRSKIRQWFTKPDCELVARREDVWGILQWYHHTVIQPNVGLRGFLRRLWLRLTGQRWELLSPWEKLYHVRMQKEAEEALARAAAAEEEATSRPEVVR